MDDLFRDIRPEDLILQSRDGSRKVNHELVKSYGLFNLDQSLRDQLLDIYLQNAVERGPKSKFQVSVFIMLANTINGFPFPVIANFTSGPAYEYNMSMLSKYAG